MENNARSSYRLLIASIIAAIVIAIVAAGMWTLKSSQQPSTVATPSTPSVKDEVRDQPATQPAVMDRQVKVAYIAVGDNGQAGEMIGCGDSVVFVDKTVQATNTLDGAMRALLADKTERQSGSGLYNALWQSVLSVGEAKVVGATANVTLSGQMQLSGVCDNPRVKAQLESTAKRASGADAVAITLNGKTLDEALSLK